ncbi:MAG: formate dehydrogenase subunit alpha [Dehalococcoidia bacterium]|nr:formate dehydrogenase subunit alpha [Dehalococcoidia bacterium]
MDTVSITIDGKQVAARRGATVLEAAQEAGIYIPTLCHHPDLKPFGACRMCLVQIEKMRGFPASCTTPVGAGMVIDASSESIQNLRRQILELMLAEHPHACLMCWKRERCGPTDTCLRQVAVDDRCVICPKNQRCELQQVSDFLGITEVRMRPFRRQRDIDRNPLFERDHDLCILCGRCVRACQDIRNVGAIDFIYRGHRTIIGTPFERPMEQTNCEFCGTCVDFCPTGSLRERALPFAGVAEREVRTVCPYCGVGCGLVLEIKGDQVIRVRGDREKSVNDGQLCVKGKFGATEFVHHKDRLTTPLIKKDGRFVEASWDEALGLVAGKFKEFRETPHEFAVISSAKCTNEENYVFQKFGRAVMGTNNVDHCARLCHSPTVAGLAAAIGSDAMTNSIKEFAKSKCLLVIGSNITENHPIIGLEVKKAVRKGAKLIVANPRRIELCGFADVWLQQRPGTDVALLAGIMKVIFAEGLQNDAFVVERCEEVETLKESLASMDMDKIAEITAVPVEMIVAAARMYATNNPAAILYTSGITQHTHGTDNVLAIANLAMLTGNIGKEGAGVNPLRGQNNLQGACDMGSLPDVYTGYQRVQDQQVKAKFEQAWGVDLKDQEGLTLPEMFEAAHNGKVRGIYLIGENPVLSDPDASHVEEAIKKLDFFVVQDIFLTETAKLADVVLPAASYAEKDGTFTNTERRVQLLRKAFEPVGSAKADWEITCEIARRMGAKGFDFGSASAIMAEIARLTPSYGGISHERLDAEGGLQWPCPTMDHPGTPIMHKEEFASGKGKFTPVKYRPPTEETDEEYPMVLTTGRIRFHYHTGTMTRRVKGLDAIRPEELVDINPIDAAKLGIRDGDMVKICSRRGQLEVKAQVTSHGAPGVVFMTFHFAEAAVNVLVGSALDPVAKIPEYKVCAVKVEKVVPAPVKESEAVSAR